MALREALLFSSDGRGVGACDEPHTWGTRRLAGMDLNKARNRHAVDAVMELTTQPEGFTLG